MTDQRKIEILEFLLWDNSPQAHTTREGMLTALEVSTIKDVIEDIIRLDQHRKLSTEVYK